MEPNDYDIMELPKIKGEGGDDVAERMSFSLVEAKVAHTAEDNAQSKHGWSRNESKGTLFCRPAAWDSDVEGMLWNKLKLLTLETCRKAERTGPHLSASASVLAQLTVGLELRQRHVFYSKKKSIPKILDP